MKAHDPLRVDAAGAPYITPAPGVGRVMVLVVAALVPGIAAHVALFGWGLLVNITLAVAAALVFEALMLAIRGRPVVSFLADGSAVVTAVLLALCLPPMAPWWLPVTGAFIAIVGAKQLYGGLGYNPFNPAMAGYAVLLIAFPLELSTRTLPLALQQAPPDLAATIAYSLGGGGAAGLDAMTAATPLDRLRTGVGLGQAMAEIRAAPVFGALAGRGMEWVNLAFLAGGVVLVALRIISWHIPVSMLATLAAVAGIAHLAGPEHYADPLFHLLGGATMLGAFFIATDPVTAATTPAGKLVYGAGIGLLIYAIRAWGGYPDGVAFAVLLMGLTVPLLDTYLRPRIFGARRARVRDGS
ncbi:MAG: RnfABCDGE type electron transport complex subunit D [Gammaproteobacteria bacterium]|nr:RnfABCDGE type electron transport complex subunit D [Gammaproteobacteria bacterium]